MPETRYQATRNKTCSRVCAGKAISKAKKDKYRTPPMICEVCGEEFRTPQRSGKRRPKYCSMKCYGKWRAGNPEILAHLTAISAMGVAAALASENRAKRSMSMDKNPAWKGGITYKRNKGNYIGPKYIRCPKEYLPMARKDGYIMEHRLVMAKHLGRLLERTEVVHHKDHNTRNNAIENLQLFSSNGEHKRVEGAARRLSRLN